MFCRFDDGFDDDDDDDDDEEDEAEAPSVGTINAVQAGSLDPRGSLGYFL